MIAFLFPGQGSQAVGMGRGFYESSPGAKALFEEANAALGFDLTKLAFEGPEAELALTANTQPAVLAASVATAAACAERGLQPAIAAGHSLGEYSALVAAGALRFADAIRVVRKRGQLMQDAVPVGTGAMAALMGLELAEVERLGGEGGTAFVEVGPGRVLTGLLKRIVGGARGLSVEDPAGLEKVLAALETRA